jgi:hypothetical protein
MSEAIGVSLSDRAVELSAIILLKIVEVGSIFATCNERSLLVIFSMYRHRTRFGCMASKGCHDGAAKTETTRHTANSRTTRMRVWDLAPHRWHKAGKVGTARKLRPDTIVGNVSMDHLQG